MLLLTNVYVFAIGQNNIINNQINRSYYDFSELSFIGAYDSMHATLALRYPFTEWKAIDWEVKNINTRPKIIDALITSDTLAFTSALFEYLYQIPDGHIELSGVSEQYKYQTVGGTYGFNMMKIDDGSVVVTYIPEESPAYIAGLRTNDRILKWNGVDIDEVGNKEYLNYFRNYATEEGRTYSRYLMLGRDSIGKVSEISYQNYQTREETTISLTAFDDSMELFLIGVYNTASPNFDSLVTYTILESNVGYLAFTAEACESMTPEEIMTCPDFLKVQEAIHFFNDNDIEDIVIDLRFNLGGNDLQAAVTMGLFYQNASFYEHITANYDYDYEVIYSLWTEPLTPLYNGDIAVIVDPNCVSTGEGLAMMFQRLDNAKIVSHWGTNASFGMVDYDPILLPADLQVVFPQARSLDESYHIQLDSDSMLKGGVSPEIKVPLNSQNVMDQWNLGVDVQLQYAQSLLLNIDYLKEGSCTLYPIPCDNHIIVDFPDGISGDFTFMLYDMLGKVVFSTYLFHNGFNSGLNVSTINSGSYYYIIKNREYEFSGKLIIAR